MSDRRFHAPHLYPQHPHNIHSDALQTKGRAAFLPPPAVLSPPYSPQLLHHAHIHSTPVCVPPYLLLQPFLQLARIDEVHQSALHSPAPAVIVSPHSLSPPPRDLARPAQKKPPVKTATAQTGSTHVPKETQRSVPTSAPTMTTNGMSRPTGASGREEPAAHVRLQRPSIVSQHSNSVPSTPLQVARRCETHSRSPSPNGGLGSHSPRSVSSEANSAMPTLRPARPFKCKFETNVGMLGRRRVPYQSDEILDRAKEEPKKTLDPHEDDKLSGDMRELYDRLQPNQHDTNIRDEFVRKVQHILETEFPGNEFKVHVFGSSGNMLWTSESDVDICIQTPLKRLEEMHPLAEAFDKHGMQRVVCIPAAKVRIVKIWDPELQLACDINVNNVAATENTRMIKTYVQLDPRVRPLAMIVKHWTKRRILNDAGIGGTISSYTWICLIVNFLQTRDPQILPILHDLPDRAVDEITGKPSLGAFADDVEKLRGVGDKNKEGLGELLFQFFRLYAHDVDYEKEAVSVRQGKRIKREELGWQPGGGHKEGVNRLCVEEPFHNERNLGNSADGYAWRGIHLELRRAFDLLADGQQLDKVCEQFEYPPEEKSSAIFKKPQSQKATISSVPNRHGRGGSNHRGGRGGLNLKGQYNGRRSSGSSSYGQGRPQFLHSPPIPGSAPPEYFAFPRGLHDQLHDQLFQQYQMLEMQSNSLRAQLAAQQQQAQHQHVRAAQMHAHAVAQAQAQGRGTNSANGSPQKSPYVNGQSPRLAEMGIPPNTLPQGFLYHYPGFYNPPQPDTSSQDGSRTNPSSPSLSNSTPGVRRGVHRASNASETGAHRSHSQPPRGGVQQPMIVGYPPIPQYFDPATLAGYPIARSTQDTPNLQPTADSQYSPTSNPPEPPVTIENTTPKEYHDYYVTEEPLVRSLQDYSVPQIPSFSELAQRRRRVSPEIVQPLLTTAMRRVSRSPSPLGGHMRSYSTGITPPIGSSNEPRQTRIDSMRPPVDSGPMIVNGSYPTPPRPRSDTVDIVPPEMPNLSAFGIYAKNQTINQINEVHNRQQLVLEEMQRQKIVEPMAPQIANGSTSSSSPVEGNGLTRVLSEGQQPFSLLSEGWIGYEPTNGHHVTRTEDISPTRAPPTQWRTPAYVNGLPSIDTSNGPRPNPQEINSATLPLLSPVFETRTPSPTANRSADPNKLMNGSKFILKEGSQNRRASHTPASNLSKESRNVQQKNGSQKVETGVKTNSGSNTPNVWQNSAPRRKGKNKKLKTPDLRLIGEPLPANAAERKGG